MTGAVARVLHDAAQVDAGGRGVREHHALDRFGYLAGLPESLVAPRRATPRARVPRGAVGIGGGQTGVYPFASPGGWNLIGRSPVSLFDVARSQPALLAVGDRVRFEPVDRARFLALGGALA